MLRHNVHTEICVYYVQELENYQKRQIWTKHSYQKPTLKQCSELQTKSTALIKNHHFLCHDMQMRLIK